MPSCLETSSCSECNKLRVEVRQTHENVERLTAHVEGLTTDAERNQAAIADMQNAMAAAIAALRGEMAAQGAHLQQQVDGNARISEENRVKPAL